MSYDAGRYGLAQRYFVKALRFAHAASNDLLAASVLDAMSHHATFLGHHREAANLARAARAGTRDHATPTLTAHFYAMEARALAAGGDAAGAERALSQAVTAFEHRRAEDDPAWIQYVDKAELNAEFAHSYRDLNRHRDAITYACQAIAGASTRSDFFVSMVLADAHAGTKEIEEACRIVREALDLAGHLKSERCIQYLRRFRRQLIPYLGTPAAHDLAEYAADHHLWIAAG